MSGRPAARPAAERWTDRDPAERRTLVNRAFVERAKLAAIPEMMDKMRRDFREGAETRCMVVVGDPGVGKSALLERYRDAAHVGEIRTEHGVKRPKPVVYVELPSDATVNVCSDAILSVLFGRDFRSGNRSKDGVLETQLAVNEVELLILDDFQHASSKGREKTRSRTADFVKGITKRTRIPVVMAGLPEVSQLIDGDRQLETITPYRLDIPRYGFDTAGSKAGFRRFLRDLDALLPFDAPAGLHVDNRSNAIHLATAGLLRPLRHLMTDAAAIAIEDRAACIRDRDLAASWKMGNRDSSSRTNPFERSVGT